jgi:hypothetical protein
VDSCEYSPLVVVLWKQLSTPRVLQWEPCQVHLPRRRSPMELWSKACQFAAVKMMSVEPLARLCLACRWYPFPCPSMEVAVVSVHWDQ